MIDSVLKGTGNSRFLKSAVPAGTSWADALAMLQAGTFPIDFNGINTKGFQQVGTPLNKANLLKDATAAQIGLPPSTTPDGMFQALGNTGELHVWRKTVKTAEDIPAGYTLEAAQSNLHVPTDGQSIDFVFSASITVGDDGTVSQPSSDYKSVYATNTYVSVLQSLLAGKFFTTRSLYAPGIEGVWYCPSNLTVSVSDNDIILSQAQKVNAHGIIPAGTTTTYPVSTNPNAYQEGDDAKPAGYVVGDMVTGMFRINAVYNNTTIYYASSVNVADNGAVTLANQATQGLAAEEDSYNNAKKLAGKFIIADYDHNYCKIPKGVVLFIPANTTISFRQDVPGDEGYGIFFDRYQPVTGYAAIPAGTTIEYLGRLVDKARVQMLSYVGTGTYGESNPNSLTFDFVPKVVFITSSNFQSAYVYSATIIPDAGFYSITMAIYMGYESGTPGGNGFVTKSNKTIMFYSGDPTVQLNISGLKYIAVAIG